MIAGIYVDHNVHGDVVRGLRRRGVNCLTAVEHGMRQVADEVLLQRASALGRVLLTGDDDLLGITARWLDDGRPFAGLIYGHPLRVSVGRVVDDVELLVACRTADDFRNDVTFLPL